MGVSLRNLSRILKTSWCFFLALTLLSVQNVTANEKIGQSAVVDEIVVQGSQRIEPETIKSYLLIRKGDKFDVQRIDRSLKSLFSTGLFSDVSILRKNNKLIVNIVENPVINRIAFEGNDLLETETLKAEISLRPRVIYTRAKVQSDVKRLLSLYRISGRFAIVIEPKVIVLPQNRVDLVYEISEGESTGVQSVRFVGNRKFSDRSLRKIVETKEEAWYRIFTTSTVYDPNRITLDRELLRRFYLTEGYADFRVNSAIAELTSNRKHFFITYTIEEGTRYKIGDLKINANLRDLKPEQLYSSIELVKGDWYDVTKVDDAIDAMTDKIGELGYAFVDIKPRLKRNRNSKQINITFDIKEGARVFVERIDISGNFRTLDKVIRREFLLVEGDAYNSEKMRRSRQRIRGLNFFSKVKAEKIRGAAVDKTIIKVEVEEKSTGSISVGAGFSSSAGALAEFGIRESNFLGRGQNVALKVIAATEQSQIDFSFTEPYLMGREVSGGIDVFHTRHDLQDSSSINTSRTGLRVHTGYRVAQPLSQNWQYSIKKSKIDSVSSSTAALIKAEVGTKYISEIGHTVTYDTRDSRLNPTEGFSTSLRTDIAGLGGNAKHLRNTVRGGYYYSISDDWILHIGGKTGYILGLGKDIGFQERYFIGGDDLRGFATSGVGPRDNPTKDALGGEWMYSGTVTLNLPLGLPEEFEVKGRIFTDFGSSGKVDPSDSNTKDTGSLRASSGFGITWRSPFGPLGMDLGFPIVKENFDITETFRINFGTQF